MNIIALIPARGGSKGVLRKNIKLLAGKPLIAYTIEAAKRCKRISRIIVTTEDEEIAQVAREYGAETPFKRPAELATDTAPTFLVIQHAVNYLETVEHYPVEIVVLLQPTVPFRNAEDIDRCITLLFEDKNADHVTTCYNSSHSPYFDMMETNANGYLELSKKTSFPVTRRQDAPTVYQLDGSVYTFWSKRVLPTGSLWKCNVKPCVMSAQHSVDINTEFDFRFAEFLLHEESRSGK
jgi:CMP-N-acetylneuraminic acid synthetase